MGSASSVVGNGKETEDEEEENSAVNDQRKTKLSVREQFGKEFEIVGAKPTNTTNIPTVTPPKTNVHIEQSDVPPSYATIFPDGYVNPANETNVDDTGGPNDNKVSEGDDGEERKTSLAPSIHLDVARRASKLTLNAAVFRAKSLFLKPVLKKRPEKDKLLVKTQNNPALVRELYQRMDPTLQQDLSSNIVSEIEVAVKYKAQENLLLVKIGRARNLPRDDGSPFPDPFVVVDLFMNPEEWVSRKTRVKHGTTDPYFQEILDLPLLERNVPFSKLRISVMDEVSSSQHVFMGESSHDLGKLDFTNGSMAWHRLYPRADISISGNISIGISFRAPRYLLVSVLQANDIKVCDEVEKTSNPYVRLQVTGLPTKHETQIVHGSTSPSWGETFEFDIHPSEFQRRVLVVNVLHKNTTCGRNQQLGDVHIPLEGYQGDEIVAEYPLKDLRNSQRSSKSTWSEEGLSIEFREALRAHINYGYPKFIFKKKHGGKMLISCRSTKAQTQAKMVINNGFLAMDTVQM